MKHSPLYSKSLLTGLLFSAFVFTSCRKDDLHVFKDKIWKSVNPLVLVAGYESNGGNRIAKYWINGQEITLSDGTNDAIANSIFMEGLEVYLAGNDGGPVYWKNNTEKVLPAKGYALANSIYVSGGHVYVAGNDGGTAVYWKDGQEIILNTTDAYGHSPGSGANSVFIAGNDVYIAGFHGANAVYWKNGEEVYITNMAGGCCFTNGFLASSIYVAGGNVYVVGAKLDEGSHTQPAGYWKNGIDETATLNPLNIYTINVTNSVFVSGNNVYISGSGYVLYPNTGYIATYWNNGNIALLASTGAGSSTSGIYVKGNDVFVSGTDGNRAVYWRNGTEVYLTDGTGSSFATATSIFIR